ncbi:MAG: hypothetical protein CM15mP101_05150 [Flavobacteriaceae bacterium]|nr:MAG: hypothetical protein CM15mP101_05150 [Flavobacteriaceae bacterium]
MDTQNYIIEFMSNEWIRNTIISVCLMFIILFISNNFFNKDQKLKIVKILSLFMIIMTITGSFKKYHEWFMECFR